MLRKTRFWYRYLRGDLPWDSGITPPEIVTLIEEEGLPPGRSIDLGCGTGTNVVYLAKHGWEATGVDFIGRAIRQGRRKARQAGVASRTRFLRGDVTRLSPSDLGGPFDLAVDIGCCHSLPVDARARYAQTLRSLVQPGGLYMLYAFRRSEKRPGGLNDDDIEALFGAHFSLNWVDYGDDLAANARSAWYQLQRTAES
jgi:cyclopropane fatty-acyl-phospholipid synthase-like methyltransferase